MTEEIIEKKESSIEEQKESVQKKEPIHVKDFFKKYWFIIFVIIILGIIVFFGCHIRTTNISSLKDVTTGNYTLGPDLDPFLYLRHAKEIVAGTLKNPDPFVQAPLGYSPNYAKTSLMPWTIVGVYKIISPFVKGPEKSVEFAADITPIILSGLTFIVFFLFVYLISRFKMSKKMSAILALISTAFYAFAPEMIHRTTGGIPEIESLGMLWFWLAFLFFTLAWKNNKLKKQIIFGAIAGIFTGVMVYSWGGFKYIFMTIGLAALLMFLFNKDKKKNFIIFGAWLIPALIIYSIKAGNVISILTSINDTAFCLGIFFLMILDLIVFNTKLKKIKEKIKLPESVISLIIIVLLGLIALLIFKPALISQTASTVVGRLIHPFGEGRAGLTVAENHAPYFSEVVGSFGWLFWASFFGIILLFYEATKHFDKNKKVWLNVFFILFLLALIFTRISSGSFLNGDNTLSDAAYIAGIVVFALVLFIMHIYSFVKKDEKTLGDFKQIDFSYLLILAFSFWMIISMRGAIRLFFIISPALIILGSYLPVKISEYAIKIKKNSYKAVLWCLVVLVSIFLIIAFVNFEKSSANEARYTTNGPYYQQWQKAMGWVRTETPTDSIFVHWWDYGYWVQTLGERPTVTDGGHVNSFWDHTTARYLMVAQNESTALQLCKAYNVSYFLIDSTDIGKYSAFASIGSDKTGSDRLSWVSTFFLNDKQTQETKNETVYEYVQGTMLDQDIVWNGQLLPAQKAGIGAFFLSIDKNTQVINSLDAIMIYNQQQISIPVRYLWINGRTYDLKKGDEKMLDSMLYIIPSITQTGVNRIGAAFYLSEKALSTEWVKLYLLNETENFELVHVEPSLFVTQLKEVYNISVGDFVYAGDLQGPIKIWKVNYPANTPYYTQYLETGFDLEGNKAWGKLDYLGV